MKIGLIGLGRMGQVIAYRLLKGGFKILAFDPNLDKDEILNEIFDGDKERKASSGKNISFAKDLSEVALNTTILWLMVPAGEITEKVIKDLSPHLKKGSIIVDGGNSNYKDTVRRSKELGKKGFFLVDCGTSGGIHGRNVGFSMMIGGEKSDFDKLKPIFTALAAKDGFGYMGPSGSGHYVKMVHNGIEYSILQSYAEGFDLLKNNKNYQNLDLEEICSVWTNGSVIRSWILKLAENIFSQDQELEKISGSVGENLTGRWTEQEALAQNIPMELLKKSLEIRKWSRETGGNYGTKVVAMLRKQFGGHKVKEK